LTSIGRLLNNNGVLRFTMSARISKMKKSRLRIVLSIAAIVVAVAGAGLAMQDSIFDDGSAAGQVRKLESIWPSRRKAAAAELGAFGNETDLVVPALVKALDDSDTAVRLSAMDSLLIYGERSRAAATSVRAILKQQPDPAVRRRAIALVGTIKDEEAVPILVEALDAPQPEIRLEALRSLGRLGDAIATKPIADKVLGFLAAEAPDEFRVAAIDTLESLHCRCRDEGCQPGGSARGRLDHQGAHLRLSDSHLDRGARGSRRSDPSGRRHQSGVDRPE
jgi:hypothetical protein